MNTNGFELNNLLEIIHDEITEIFLENCKTDLQAMLLYDSASETIWDQTVEVLN